MKIQNIFVGIFLALLLVSTVSALPHQLTIRDGDEYFCEDKNDPNWVWNLKELNQGLIIVQNDFVKNDDTDDPVGEGQSYVLPNKYARIYFNAQGSDRLGYIAKVSVRDKDDRVLDATSVRPGKSLVESGISSVLRLDRKSFLLLGSDSPSIESAETSNDDDYGENLFMEVTRSKIKSVSFITSGFRNTYRAKVLGDNLRFRINENSITLVGRTPSC